MFNKGILFAGCSYTWGGGLEWYAPYKIVDELDLNSSDVLKDDKQGIIRVFLKYGTNGERVITNLKRISKPGLRVYSKRDDIPKVLNGLGIAIISTSEGLLTDKEARQKNLGGEVIAYVW